MILNIQYLHIHANVYFEVIELSMFLIGRHAGRDGLHASFTRD